MNKKALRLNDYVHHMRDAADRIQRYTFGKSQLDFTADEQLQDAVVRNIEIIGEAARNVSLHAPEFAQQHVQIPWAALYAMRNRVSHGYWTIGAIGPRGAAPSIGRWPNRRELRS